MLFRHSHSPVLHSNSRARRVSANCVGMQAPAAITQGEPIAFTRVKGILFDIDGTLCNSDPLHFKAFQELLVEHGYNGGKPIDEKFYRARISGRHNPEIAADLWPDRPEEWRTWFYQTKEKYYRDMAGSKIRPLEGLGRFMAWIQSRGLRSVAVTNAPRDNAEMMLKGLKLDNTFEALILGEECTRPKPFPDPYQDGLRILGLEAEPSAGLVLEDSPSGIKAAVAAGISVVGLTTGQEASTLVAAGANLVVTDFDALMDIIENSEVQ
ncbi:HAD-like domain-containing protein [Dunaliella salina]|uniref:HAD-like domain-containing protein n=1 Tax=Dunaliella salina TaxID=3046 RepID=A0ABQ7GVU7_DUNSA|nr:HAD-like domain-containing protein [Dunaliella salina]|eukprot:KAF5838741.1 HAD-like domain-containing protein [Dunaliella salina]